MVDKFMTEKFMGEEFMVEKFMVEKSRIEMSCNLLLVDLPWTPFSKCLNRDFIGLDWIGIGLNLKTGLWFRPGKP